MTFGAHRCLQVLSLGFGTPWERKGRETKGFWGWGSMTQVQVRGWPQVWARLGCTVWGCWGMQVAQLEEASLPGSCRESQGAGPKAGWGAAAGVLRLPDRHRAGSGSEVSSRPVGGP